MVDTVRDLYGPGALERGRFGYSTQVSSPNRSCIAELRFQLDAFIGVDIVLGSNVSYQRKI